MTDIVERLHDYAADDHKRGCQGRCYSCECGYDDRRDPLLVEAADEIERLRTALIAIIDSYDSLNVPWIEVIENARKLVTTNH